MAEARSRALEEKRRRLEEMKQRKAARELESSSTQRDAAAESERKAAELRLYVDGLLAQPTPASPTAAVCDSPDSPASPAPPPALQQRAADPPPPPPVHKAEVYDQSTQTAADEVVAAEVVVASDDVFEEVAEVVVVPAAVSFDESALTAFLDNSARLVERCLGEADVFDALRGRSNAASVDDCDGDAADGGFESVVATFDGPRWCKGRCVTAVKTSVLRPDVVLCSYSKSGTSSLADFQPLEYDGSVLIWSLARTSTPENAFACQSAVLCACWDASNAAILVGGTHSGQIVLWDTRSPSTLPVQRSPLDAGAPHARGIVALRPRSDGTFATASSDGVVCCWSAAQLQRPVDTQVVAGPGEYGKVSQPVAISAMELCDSALPDAAQHELLVGDERGCLFATRAGRVMDSSAAAVRSFGDGHFGTVTSVKAQTSNSARDKDLNGMRRSLFLTTSIDWTARLWSTAQGRNAPLAVFEHGAHEYVTDAEWSPQRASLFATTTSGGLLSLWRCTRSNPAAPQKRVSSAALTRLAWSDDGRRIACADAAGATRVLKLSDALAATDAHDDARLDALLA